MGVQFRGRFFARTLTRNGSYRSIAKDVKVQIEFSKKYVARYRLIGYENRNIADKDFRNDKVDSRKHTLKFAKWQMVAGEP